MHLSPFTPLLSLLSVHFFQSSYLNFFNIALHMYTHSDIVHLHLSEVKVLILHQKTTAETIRIQYEKNCPAPEPWVLKYESKVVSLKATMADLSKHGDQVVVLRAAKASDNSQLNNPQPLQPRNNQVLSPSQGNLQSSRNIENVKPSLGGPYGHPSIVQDENSIPQQNVRPQQAYAAVAQQISAPGLGAYANHYKHTLPSINSHGSIPASRMATQLPSQGYQVTSSSATQAHYPATPVSLPPQSQSTPNQSTLMSITRSSSPMSPSDVEATNNGFNLFCRNSRARFRILYPNDTEGIHRVVRILSCFPLTFLLP